MGEERRCQFQRRLQDSPTLFTHNVYDHGKKKLFVSRAGKKMSIART